MSGCDKYQALISAMLDGELSEAETAEVQAHVASCDECRAMYEAFAAISSAVAAEEPLPETLHAGIMSRVSAAEKAKQTHGKIIRFQRIAGLAACLVVVVGTFFALKNNLLGASRSEQEDAPAAAEEAPMMMAAFSGAGDSARTESFALTEGAAEEECAEEKAAGIAGADTFAAGAGNVAPAEAPAPNGKAAANSSEPIPEPMEAPAPENGAGDGAEAERSMTVEIKELMPYDAFICFLVVDTETDEVWELHLTEDTQMTDEVREALVPGCVVTVEYHTRETDQRPVIYADEIRSAE